MIRKIIEIDESKCDGCGLCSDACHEGAIGIIGGVAKLVREDYCDGLGSCLPACPSGAIAFIEREADDYNEQEARSHLMGNAANSSVQSGPNLSKHSDAVLSEASSDNSCLANWPVQIQLAPVRASCFDNADLLIAADCAAYASANFHSKFMRGKTTLIGCPKLDGVDYSEKLFEIIKANEVKSLTVVRMQVPCCKGIEQAVADAIKKSAKPFELRTVVLGTKGDIQKE
ncbi:MAG: 4Fe-4S binding protein [Eubacteriaceae bacterium]|nr:4Fe-4S binding protein [Eubacteriaceae bacterium]